MQISEDNMEDVKDRIIVSVNKTKQTIAIETGIFNQFETIQMLSATIQKIANDLINANAFLNQTEDDKKKSIIQTPKGLFVPKHLAEKINA